MTDTIPEGWTRHELGAQVFYYHQATNTTSNEFPIVAQEPQHQSSGTGAQVNHHPPGFDGFVMPAPSAMQAVEPRTEPLLPPAAVFPDSADEKASKRGWLLYGLSLACCCFCTGIAHVFSPAAWLVLACKYLKKTPQERERFPKQRAVALTSLATCAFASCCVCLVLVLVIGFGAGFVLATHSQIAADLESVVGHCASVAAYEKAACPDGFTSCERWPTLSERNSMCTDVSKAMCGEVVKERDVKDVFDLLCDDRMWQHIQKNADRHHSRHHMPPVRHGHHWHSNPAILYVSKGRAIQYVKKCFPKSWLHKKGHYGGKHHDDKERDYYDYDSTKEAPKSWYYKQWFHDKHHDVSSSELQV